MCTYLKNMEGYKLNDLKLKDFDSIQEMFDRAFKRVNIFEDFRTDLVEGKEKRAGTELIQENAKREDLEDLYKLVKAKYESTKPVEDLDLLLWGDLKTMFEPHVKDAVWRNQQAYKVLDWKLYDSYGGRIVGTKSLLNAVWITVAHVFVNAAQLELVLLMNFKENMLIEVNAVSENMLGVSAASEYQVNAASYPGKVLGIISKRNMRIPIYLGNVRGTSASDALHVMVPYEAFACLCRAEDVVLRESYKSKTCGKLYYACPRSKPRENTFGCEFFLWKEEQVRLLVGSPGASTTPIYSPGSSSTPIYSPGSSTPPRYSPRASTPQSYSPGTLRNAECSNYKHLLDKITVLEATVDMYMHPEQHTVNTAALFHEVYNNIGKLDLE
ncbi:hypothetical protein Tco_0091840 [Tanacetum coccineum]